MIVDMQVAGSSAEQAATTGSGGRKKSQSFLEAFVVYPDDKFDMKDGGLKVAVLRDGDGQSLKKGMRLKVHYTGWLTDGTRFDTSMKRNEPFEFTLGSGQVIKGWEQGMAGIKPGERRQLIIPAELAYGERGTGNIPPGSTLIFNVEAVGIEGGSKNEKGQLSITV